MDRYIGLDVHAASSTVAIVSQAAKKLKNFVVETNGRHITEAIPMIAGKRHVILEEGTQSAWLHEILQTHAEEVVVTRVSRRHGRKDDARDAYALVEQLRIGAVERPIFKATGGYAVLKIPVAHHTMIGRDLVRIQNRIKSVYRSRGIRTPGRSAYTLKARQDCLAKLPAASARGILRLYEHYDLLRDLKKQPEADLLQELTRHWIARVLVTAPGMGLVRVAKLLPIVVTPHRLRTKRQFWSYCGLGIVMRSSSDWIQAPEGHWVRAPVNRTRGLTRHGNRELKEVFKGAATTVITQVNKGPMCARYQRLLEQGTKPNLAKVTLARQIAAIVLRMWKDEEVYDPQRTIDDTMVTNVA